MRTTLLLLALLLLPIQQPEDYPGQANHATPPEGWMCQPQNIELSVPADHVCNCERMYDAETNRVIEDATCSVYCHMDHCACAISNQREIPK